MSTEPKRPGKQQELTEREMAILAERLAAGDDGKCDSDEYLAKLEKRLANKQPVPR